MSEVSISLDQLLNLSIGAPHKGVVNFGALYELLRAVLAHLGIRDLRVKWRQPPPGRPDSAEKQRPVEVGSAGERDAEGGSCSPSPQPRVPACEEGVNRAMKLIEELRDQKKHLKEEMEELRLQQETLRAPADSAVEEWRPRLDAVEETVGSLRAVLHRGPDPEELSRCVSQCVTWDDMHSALLGDRENTHKELDNPGIFDERISRQQWENTSLRDDAKISADVVPAPDAQTDTHPATEAPPRPSGSPPPAPTETGGSFPSKAGSSHRRPESVEALRGVGKLKRRHEELEARVAALEEVKAERTQLEQLRELLVSKGSQDVYDNLRDQLQQQRALIGALTGDQEKNTEVVSNVQRAILQLQADSKKLHETSVCLHEENKQKQNQFEELCKMMEELEEKKADKQMVETEIKADKCALDSKVSRLQFDSATEQLSAMFHELLNKVTDQEQDWHKVIGKLSAEMECKLNRLEWDSMKKQLEDRWRNIQEKLLAQAAPEHEDAAAIRKQLVDRFHCLSCDRPVVKHIPGPHLVTLPSSPGFPARQSIRPFTVYALEQFRQHYRSERISEVTDYSHLAVSRSCGGSHTIVSASQRRGGGGGGLQHIRHHAQTEAGDAVVQSEEVDIIGLDGHIYKGRLNASSLRSTDTKLPTIPTKDGVCKTKDKARSSPSHRAPASPEPGHAAGLHPPHSAKSTQCSRSASCSSGRDWPVSALGCASQSSFAHASAAADSSTEPPDHPPLNL